MNQFKKHDTVECMYDNYVSYDRGERAKILEVDGHLIKLPNALCDYGFSWYSSQNFQLVERNEPKQETQTVGYAKTQYFAVKLDQSPNLGDRFLHIENTYSDGGEEIIGIEQTVLRLTKSEAVQDAAANIKEGEKWVVLQTVTIVEPKAPVLPVKLTELR